MSVFTLAICCLSTSSLPWFMDLTSQVPMQYCSWQLRTSITSHMHYRALFLLWLHLFILSWSISPLFFSSILGTYQPGEFVFQCHIFCLFILFMGFSRQEYWCGLPFPSPVSGAVQQSLMFYSCSYYLLQSLNSVLLMFLLLKDGMEGPAYSSMIWV